MSAYSGGPNVVWSVEMRGVRILNTSTGESRRVPYPQAAIWDLLMRDAPLVNDKVAAIAGLRPDEAERLIAECVRQWVAEGFLTERQT